MVSVDRTSPDEHHAAHSFTYRDEGDLSWFFSIGASTFERSTFGDMVERLRQFAEDESGKRIPASETLNRAAWEFMQGQCAHPARHIPQQLADDIRLLIEWDELDPRITAQPTGSRQRGGEHGYTPNHPALMRFALVSRRLSRLPMTSRAALALYFGLEGARWVTKHLGRITILMPKTASGRALLERFGHTKDGSPMDGSPAERVHEIWQKNTGVKNEVCSKLIRDAESQAYELLNAAKVAYSETI